MTTTKGKINRFFGLHFTPKTYQELKETLEREAEALDDLEAAIKHHEYTIRKKKILLTSGQLQEINKSKQLLQKQRERHIRAMRRWGFE